jgi:hypothetical protein
MLYCLGRPQIHPLGFACVDTGPTARRARSIARGCNLINTKIMVWPFDGRMAFSRRDSTIVARHEVPGYRCKEGPVPEGRLKSLSVPSKPRSVQSSSWDGPIFLMIPGTSCLAMIVLSLRDKNHAPIEAPRIILALMGLQTWAKFFGPFGQ